ncbi:MAG: 3-oxoacid CoA-transferase subunit B [Cyanobacteria bacterium P01_H01_bin.74]
MTLSRSAMVSRIAQELKDGYTVNLGIGIPTLVANAVPDGISVLFQSENGLLGMGPFPTEAELDPDLINAGKQTVTAVQGAAFFSSSESFAMIRGGHVDLTILGAFEVDTLGNIASWMIPGKLVKGMGGAMDLVSGADNIIVAMSHTSRDGSSKIKHRCGLPLTGVNCVSTVITDMAVLAREGEAYRLLERAPGVCVETIQAATEATLIVSGEIPEMVVHTI